MKQLKEYKNISRFIRENAPEDGGIFHLPSQEFLALIENPAYETFKIPKKNGGFRNIQSPATVLKQIQRCFCLYLNTEYNTIKPECVHGFVSAKGKTTRNLGIFSNALPHINKAFILNIDIKDFFPSIKAAYVKALLLRDFDLNDHMASVITQLCTYEKYLPSGAPTSPILSNIYCREMDYELMRLAAIHNLTYTRYADDLTFSSNDKVSEELIDEIKKTLNSHGFVINKRKLRIKSKHQQQTVTGLVVNRKVNVKRKYKKRLRAILHDIRINGYVAAAKKHYKNNTEITERKLDAFKYKIGGMKAFVSGIKNENIFTETLLNENN